MRTVTLVTGPLRSGTSCVTGLLELSGFDLGRAVRVMRNPTEHNPLGHFEPDLLVTINERLLMEAAGARNPLIGRVTEQALRALASRREHYFRLFIRKFDGELCKDPFMSLTLFLWEERWPELRKVIFCLRHPAAVARSMEKRYGIPWSRGLETWLAFAEGFFDAPRRSDLFIFDFDAFTLSPVQAFSALLTWLGRPLEKEDLKEKLDGFFRPGYLRSSLELPDEQASAALPARVRERYMEIKSSTSAEVG